MAWLTACGASASESTETSPEQTRTGSETGGPNLVTLRGLVVLECDGARGSCSLVQNGRVVFLSTGPERFGEAPPPGSVVDVRAYDNRWPGLAYPALFSLNEEIGFLNYAAGATDGWIKRVGERHCLTVLGHVGSIDKTYFETGEGEYEETGEEVVELLAPIWSDESREPEGAANFGVPAHLRTKLLSLQWDEETGSREPPEFDLALVEAKRGSWYDLLDVRPAGDSRPLVGCDEPTTGTS
jgi:hypothetical protein